MYLGISQSLTFRILTGNIPLIPLKLDFTPNTLGCYGLISNHINWKLSTSSLMWLLLGLLPYFAPVSSSHPKPAWEYLKQELLRYSFC